MFLTLGRNARTTSFRAHLCLNSLYQRYLTAMSGSRPSVAIVLSGCGVFDGAEVHEASAVMVSLSRQNIDYQIYAPNKDQMHVINHTNGQEMQEQRNVLVESARIARGKIKPLSDLNASSHNAVIFPGGFGAAKNLCDFAVKQADCCVDPDVEKVIKTFHGEGKPIGMCCIAPVIAAKVLKGCEVTVGMDKEENGRWPYAGTTGAITACGSTYVNKDVGEVHVDTKNKVVTTPAYMCETAVHEIHDGIGEMVKAVLKLL